MIPRGFTRCDVCEGTNWVCQSGTPRRQDGHDHAPCQPWKPCPSCSGSGLLPTEKLREEMASMLLERQGHFTPIEALSDAVLRKVAEHIGEER